MASAPTDYYSDKTCIFFTRCRLHYKLTVNFHKTYIMSVNSVADMYKLYCKKYEENNILLVKVPFSGIFLIHPLILLKVPRYDSCRHCAEYENCITFPVQYV